jgi:hypothetical protein
MTLVNQKGIEVSAKLASKVAFSGRFVVETNLMMKLIGKLAPKLDHHSVAFEDIIHGREIAF